MSEHWGLDSRTWEAPTLEGRALADLGQQLSAMRADCDAARAELAEWKAIACEMHDALIGDGRAGMYDHDRMERAIQRFDAAAAKEGTWSART